MSISDLFADKKLVKVCAPMVRYSKLEFRKLVREYGCDLCFTPMIMADSFVRSEKARNHEFTTDSTDSPVIVQFAAKNEKDFSEAAQLVLPYSNGVDLNCGCPQRWALKSGIGAHLLSEPQTIKNIVLKVRNQVPSNYSVSVKLRLMNDKKSSIDLCRQLEKTGITFLTVHGRTKEQRRESINTDALKDISQSIQIPMIANGDVKSLEDAISLQKATGCQGVMSARGLLQNPALFNGFSMTPVECVKKWIKIALNSQLPFMTFHHHLVFMLHKILPKPYRLKFNTFTNYQDVLCFLNDYYDFNFNFNICDLSASPNNFIGNKQAKHEYNIKDSRVSGCDDNVLLDILGLYN